MSYTIKVDEMVGKHVAQFQQELSLAKTMRDCLEKPCPMPYGYPLRVWCPRYVRRSPQAKRFVPRVKGRLSNGIPAVLRLRLSDGYVLGIYYPQKPSPIEKAVFAASDVISRKVPCSSTVCAS